MDNENEDLDPEQGDKDPHVPAELLQVYEINEWREAIGLPKLGEES